jgi:hypothetical protein
MAAVAPQRQGYDTISCLFLPPNDDLTSSCIEDMTLTLGVLQERAVS